MDATPTKRPKSRGEFTPLLRESAMPRVVEAEFSPSFSPSFLNLRSRLITLDSEQEAPAQEDSPILKRTRYASTASPEVLGPDFLVRKLREASSGAQAQPHASSSTPAPAPLNAPTPARAPVRAPEWRTPPSSNGLEDVLIAKQSEINGLRARLEQTERQSYAAAEQAHHALQSEKEQSKLRDQELRGRIEALELELAKTQKQAAHDKNTQKVEIVRLKNQLAEAENTIHDLENKFSHERDELRKTRLTRDEARTKAANYEKVSNELEAMLTRARTTTEKAETQSITAMKQAEEATSVKTKLMDQINTLQERLELQDEDNRDALDQKQQEINQGKVKIKELQESIKTWEMRFKTLELAEHKLREETAEWQQIVTQEKIKTKRVQDQLKVAKGEIAELKDDIQNNARVNELTRQLNELKDIIKRQSAILEEREQRQSATLEERDQRIKALEYKISDPGRTAELEVYHSKVAASEQNAHRLSTEVTSLQSKLRESQYTINSQQSKINTLANEVQIRDGSIAGLQRTLNELQGLVEQAQKEVSTTNSKFQELNWKYNQIYSQYSAEIENLRDAARAEITQKERDLTEAASAHLQQLDELRRQCDQEILNRHQELEQKFVELSTSSGNSLAQALRNQREELEQEYNQHAHRIDQNAEDRISKIKELAELQVNEHKRILENQFKIHSGRVEELEENIEHLQSKLDKTLKAFQLVLEYHAAREARNQFVMDDLVFIKGIAQTCLEQIDQEDRHHLAALGLEATPKRTFAGAATFALALARMHRLSRPQVSDKLKHDYNRFIRTQRLD